MDNKVLKIILLSACLFFVATLLEPAFAQCAMCKASSETNLKAGGGDPRGLNAGILYMLLCPYVIVGGIAFWWWRNRKPEQTEAPV